MIQDEASDADLVAAVLNGERTAFGTLMTRHKSWLFAFIRRHTSTSEDAYDILQDSFAAAWKALKTYDPARPFDAWIRRIALNKCRDRGRKEAVRRRVFSLIGLPPGEDPRDAAAGAESVRIAGEAVARLNAAVQALPLQLREALVLTALQGLSQRDAAEALGTNVKVVEMRVYRARKVLAEKLGRSDIVDLEALD